MPQLLFLLLLQRIALLPQLMAQSLSCKELHKQV
jgi:hypothetical protein